MNLILLTEDEEFHPEKLNELTTPEARDHAAKLLPDALGDQWAELCSEHLPRFPADVVETVIERIVASGKGPILLPLWDLVHRTHGNIR